MPPTKTTKDKRESFNQAVGWEAPSSRRSYRRQMGKVTLTNDYFEGKSECHAIAVQDDSEDELNFPVEEDEGPPHVHQMQLRAGKVLQPRQLPSSNDKNKGKEVEEENIASKRPSKRPNYNILAHLKKVPALLSMYDALMMSAEVRDSLIHALQNPEEYQAYFAEINMKEALYAFHAPSVSFTDEDLLLGTTEHNRPLYVTGYCDGMKINRVLIDPGSSVNLMTLNTLRTLALEICHLSPERIIIQGFNQHSQKALGSITLPIKFGKMTSDVKFHVIDADASYKALLGRPWIHENHVVPSTLHQWGKLSKGSTSSKGGKPPSPKEESLVKAPKSAPALQKKESVLPHFGSDTESSDDESDDDEDQAGGSIQENTLHITRIPEGLYKSLADLSVNTVEHLKTFYVPARHEGERGVLFYKAKSNKIPNDDVINIKGLEDDEVQPIRFPNYYPDKLKEMFENFAGEIKWSRKSYQNFHRLWNPTHIDKRGIGYSIFRAFMLHDNAP
ncbi:hypothetical protein J5N97_013818 [Dioscorea zingiberensis]|uniref:Uncharacterized protein n=1 Tax=Dioscorea zingiberensis TaxID=325984 RepID=A0A9D5CSZ8_9LILI|nr:hypothetical protein J5N97_013818 [Dioscorea zingiberensis]